MDVDPPGRGSSSAPSTPLSQSETELVRLANIILFPDKYEFYMATRNSTPDGGRTGWNAYHSANPWTLLVKVTCAEADPAACR